MIIGRHRSGGNQYSTSNNNNYQYDPFLLRSSNNNNNSSSFDPLSSSYDHHVGVSGSSSSLANIITSKPQPVDYELLNSYKPISRFNFLTPIDLSLSSEDKCKEMMNRMREMKKIFNEYKRKLAAYERKKKKISKKSPLIRRFYEFIKRKILTQRKQCFTCHVLIKPPYYFCSSINCRLIYCEPCFSDFLLTCLNCGVNGPPYVCLFD